jgi:hypothetical protein
MLLSDVVTCKTLNVPSIKVELSLIAFLGRGIGNVDHFAKRTLFLENQTLSSLFLLFFKKMSCASLLGMIFCSVAP